MDKKAQGVHFRFRKNESIGAAEAESDDAFLFQCFVDTGELEMLRDCQESRRIIIGRTGAGKSALIRVLREREAHVIELKPENLAVNYLANSEVLRFFDSAGTNLDPFYMLLWKHVIAVELIRYRYKITNEQTQRSFFERFTGLFARDRTKEQALDYLGQWGNEFWNETEARVREVTSKIESALKGALEGSAFAGKLDASFSRALTTEEKSDVVQRGSRAVSHLQLAALNNVLKLLEDEVFTDQQESHFIVIDDLDTRWVDDQLRYKLIRALIECVKSFRQVRQVKIVVALRLDLLQRVISATRDAGFQSEKYESMYLRLNWSADQLHELISRRVARLVRERYTSKSIPIDSIFPREIRKTKFLDFVSDRTFLRPRDAILLTNECIARAADKQQITVEMVLDAEAAHSQKRIDSLQEEWSGVYYHVSEYLSILSRKPASFPVSELSQGALESWAVSTLLEAEPSDAVVKASQRFFAEGHGTFFEFVLALVDALYVIGAVGIKPDATSGTYWSYSSDHRPSPGSIKNYSVLFVHPTFWRALGINPHARGNQSATQRARG